MRESANIRFLGRAAGALVLAIALAAPAAAQSKLPDGPGKQELTKVCSVCHQAERAVAVRLTREGWKGIIGDMIAQGASGTDAEFAAIIDYLSTHFLGEAARPLNINSANQLELESVAGLLRREAAAVLKYLEKLGACKSLQDLKKVPGLDYKKIEDRKDFLVCAPSLVAPRKSK